MMDGVETGDKINARRELARGLGMRLARHFLRVVGFLMLASAVAFAGGFLIFYQQVATLKQQPNPKADAIVVLTGGYQRVDLGVQLLQAGAGERLLISGVNPATSGNHLRLLTRSTTNLFDCCVDIGHDALDTAGNATETVRWIRAHHYRSVLLVTSNYHMPRSLAEIRLADDHSEFIPYPVESGMSLAEIGRNPMLLKTLASEYVKYLLVQSRGWTGITI